MLAGDLRRTLGQQRWRRDPVTFIREVLVNPETGQPFELYPVQEHFLREGLTLTENGRLPYPELVFSGPKKSGKTGLAAMAVIYVVKVLAGSYGEGYCLANDLEQDSGPRWIRSLLSYRTLSGAGGAAAPSIRASTSERTIARTIQRVPSEFGYREFVP